MSNIIIFDTETTGLIEPIEPIEVGFLVIDFPSYKIKNEHCNRLRPSKDIEFGAMATSHILPEDIRDCLPSDVWVWDENKPLRVFGEQVDYIIGHNIDYDWKVIGKPNVKRICTQALARYLIPNIDSYSQSALLYYFLGSKARPMLKNAHNALCDVKNCLTLLKFLLANRPQITTIEELYALSEIARIPTKISFGKYKGTALKDIPKDYIQWLRKQPDLDPYLLIALRGL